MSAVAAATYSLSAPAGATPEGRNFSGLVRASEALPLDIPASDRYTYSGLAKAFGLSPEDAYALYGPGDAFNGAVSEIRRAYPGQFSSAYYGLATREPTWVHFSGEVPAGAPVLLGDLAVDVKLRSGAALTEAEGQDLTHSVIEALNPLVASSADLTVGTGEVAGVVTVRSSEQLSDSAMASAVAAITEAASPAATYSQRGVELQAPLAAQSTELKVVVDPSLNAEPEYLSGGGGTWSGLGGHQRGDGVHCWLRYS